MAEKQTVATFITQSQEFLEQRHTFYKPLDPNRREIRLMHIQPGQYQDPMHLTLSTVDLLDEPVYETISYTWEDMSQTKEVYIHGLAYNITLNQYAALRRLRLPSETKILWMDVICIDQANLQERAHQVSIMGSVYANAARTDVWLGDLSASWREAMSDEDWNKHVAEFKKNKTMSSIFKTASTPSALRDELVSKFLQIVGAVERAQFVLEQFVADVHIGDFPYCSIVDEELILCRQWYDTVNMLLEILRRPWWTRVWVLQEVLLCKGDPQVLFGSFVLPFSLFMDAANSLVNHTGIVRCCAETMMPVFCSVEVLDRLFGLTNISIIKAAHEPGLMPINKAIQLTRKRNATDARDHVYGVLGLITPDDRVKVDYTLTTAQVFAYTSWYVFRSRNDFTWLDKGALPDDARTPAIPTWSVDWVDVDRMGFRHNDSFEMVEEPDWERTRYAGNLELVANRVAELRLVLAKVKDDDESTDCRNQHTRIWSWLRDLRDAGLDIRAAEWTVDNYQDDKHFFDFFATVFRDTVARIKDITDVQTTRLGDGDWKTIFKLWDALNSCMQQGTDQAYPGAELLMTAIALDLHTQGCTLALTTEDRLCLVPETSEVGDSLYHIRACCPPIVLREVGEDSTFQVVGSAYLRGSMGSEGWRKAEEKVITLK